MTELAPHFLLNLLVWCCCCRSETFRVPQSAFNRKKHASRPNQIIFASRKRDEEIITVRTKTSAVGATQCPLHNLICSTMHLHDPQKNASNVFLHHKRRNFHGYHHISRRNGFCKGGELARAPPLQMYPQVHICPEFSEGRVSGATYLNHRGNRCVGHGGHWNAVLTHGNRLNTFHHHDRSTSITGVGSNTNGADSAGRTGSNPKLLEVRETE